jgi:hypothetical protein
MYVRFILGVALASSVGITADQLTDSWTVHSLNRSVKSLDVHAFEAFRTDVLREYRDNIDGVTNTSAVVTRFMDDNSGTKRQQTTLPNVTPPAKKVNNASKGQEKKGILSSIDNCSGIAMSPSLPPPKHIKDENATKSDKYGTRTDSGKIISSFTPSNLTRATRQKNQLGPKCTLSSVEFNTNVRESYRHMFTTIDERSAALEKHLQYVGDYMIDRYNLGTLECRSENDISVTNDDIAGIEEVGVPRQEKVCCIGRICNSVSLIIDLFLQASKYLLTTFHPNACSIHFCRRMREELTIHQYYSRVLDTVLVVHGLTSICRNY